MEEVNEFRDPGITTEQHLRWNLHIDKVVAKANMMLGLIKRTCRDFGDRKTLRTLYCALLLSNLEYCYLIWSPYTIKGIEMLQKVQKRANKFFLKTEDCAGPQMIPEPQNDPQIVPQMIPGPELIPLQKVWNGVDSMKSVG